MNNMTLQDCIDKARAGQYAVLNDGQLLGFEEDKQTRTKGGHT